MKRFLFLTFSIFVGFCADAQITILNEDVQEKIVTKPEPFDSLSDITFQYNPIQYKKYIGYKLYCRPISNKRESTYNISYLRYKSPRKFKKKHIPFEQSVQARIYGNISKLKGSARTSYERQKEEYENDYIINTSVYKATEGHNGDIHTPYDSIQNTYFTILNIEIAKYLDAQKGKFVELEDWNDEQNYYLRFTLKHEKSGEELYWICRNDKLRSSGCFFLVPYFEKMQKLFKGQNVVATTNLDNLVDINSGQPVNVKAEELWLCYDVTFVHSKDDLFVVPVLLLDREDIKIKIPFKVFTEECSGFFSSEDKIDRQRFILEEDYNRIITERKRSAEEKQRIEEEKLRIAEENRVARNKQIMNKYGNKYGKLICEGQVCLNMTKEMCIEAWGEPNYINSTIVKGLVHEQWVYGGSYLYFDNGILIGIQN